MPDKKTPSLPFLRAFDIIMHRASLRATEKLVLLECCRYFPHVYTGSNATISYNTGLSIRTIQYALKSLSTGPAKRHRQSLPMRRAHIVRHYVQTRLRGKLYTRRIIAPICLPGCNKPPPAWAKQHPTKKGKIP